MSAEERRLLAEEPSEEPVAMSTAEQSALLTELSEKERESRRLKKELDARMRKEAREADSKFGFLTKLGKGKIKCGIYRENPKTLEFEYVPEGKVLWDVDREDKNDFQQKIATLFGAGRYQIELQFPEGSGLEDSILEISVADRPKTAADERPQVVQTADPNSGVATEFAKFMSEMQRANQEMFKWMIEQSQRQSAAMAEQTQKQNAAMMEAVKASLSQTSRPDPSRDEMLKLVTELVKSQGGNVKQVDPITMLTGLAQVMSSMKLLAPAPAGGFDPSTMMTSLLKAMELGASVSGGGGGEVVGDGGESTMDKLMKFGQMIMPFLGGLMTPKPQAQQLPPIQQQPPQPPQPRPQPAAQPQTRPQPRDVGRRPQAAQAQQPSKPIPQPAAPPAPTDMQKAKADIDMLVDEINNAAPEDAALMIKQNVAPQFLELAKTPDNVLALIAQFRPELANDGTFGIKLRQVCAALNK